MKKLFFLLILVLFIPILFLDFYKDAHVFAYVGKVIFDGGVPYVDAWDHKGITLYFINAMGYGIVGFKSLIGIRILEFLLILYTFLRFFTFASKEYSKLIAYIAGIFGLFTFKYFFDGGNLTEEYGTLFSILSVVLLLKQKKRTIDYALVGVFLIINFTIRANLISLWVALFLVYMFQLVTNRNNFKTILTTFLKMGYGAITFSLGLLIYMLATNSLNSFIESAFTFNFSYSSSAETSVFSSILTVMKRYHLSIILLLGLVVSVIRFYKDKNRFLELLLIFWIPIELYFSSISQKLYAHYFLMWVPIIIFSIVVILSEIKERFQISNYKIVIGSLLLFLSCYYIPLYGSLLDWKRVIVNKENKYEKVATYVNDTYPDDSMLVWGNSAAIYNKTNKIAPVSFFYHSSFKYNTELIREKIKDFTNVIENKKPQLIIDTKLRGLVQLDQSNLSTIDESQINNLKRFLRIIETDYVRNEEKYGYVFYKLKKDE